ncbi:MAG TPA: DUF4870 domain-containing protein [Anaerolineaceae bacterium]
MNTPQTLHTQDERTFAALAHGSGLLSTFGGGFLGIIAALVIWLTQKEKSSWVAFHALQSLVLQGVILVFVLLIVGGTWVIGFLISFITIGFGTIITVPIMILTMFLGMAIGFGGLIYQLVAAVQVYNGNEFRYKWIGDWVAQRMSVASQAATRPAPPANPASSERGEPLPPEDAPVSPDPVPTTSEPQAPAVASEQFFNAEPAEPEPTLPLSNWKENPPDESKPE